MLEVLSCQPVFQLPKQKTQESEVNYAYKPWSEKEVEKLRFEYEVGIPIDKIAKNHGRTNEDVRSRLKKEGLIEE